MNCSPPGSSVHRISQTRILEWVAIPFSRGSSQTRDQTHSPSLAGMFFVTEPPGKPPCLLLWPKGFKRLAFKSEIFVHSLFLSLNYLYNTPVLSLSNLGRNTSRDRNSAIPQFSSVHSLSRVRLFATPWITARQASLSITNSWSLLRFMSIESVMPSSHLILCHTLLLLPPIPPSIRVFSNESTVHMRWPKYWSFSFSISPFNEHQGLISFRMDRLHLLAVQGTLSNT